MLPRLVILKLLLRATACAALLYHLCAVAITNLPRNTALGPALHAWFAPYTSYFGLWQDWAMFTTIPYYSRLVPTLEVKQSNGTTVDYGPLLPELRAAPDSLRLTSLFGRLVWSRSTYSSLANRYDRTACRAVQHQTSVSPASVRIRLDGQRLHALEKVRAIGETSYPQQATSGVFSCPQKPNAHRNTTSQGAR